MAMLKLAIIGAGIMGERLARAAREHASDVVEITALWDRAPAASARLAEALPGLPVVTGADAAMAAADCIYIASPPASHLEYAETALALGKSVFCEKPLSVDPTQGRRFVAKHGTERIAVNFPFASSVAVERLTEWMAANGAPVSLTIDVAFRVWPRPWQHDAASWLDRRAEGGFTREVVSHFLFLSRRLLGPLRRDESLVQYPGDGRSEFDIRAQLHAGTVPVNLTGNVGNTDKDDHNIWTLRCEHGAVRLRDWSIAERQEGDGKGDGKWHADPGALPNERMRPLVLRRQLEEVAKMTRGDAHRLATIQEAFDVQQIVEAILAS
jgi:predicted dehydrogenase